MKLGWGRTGEAFIFVARLESPMAREGPTRANRREFLYRIQAARPEMVSAGPTTEEAEIIAAHVAYLEGLSEKGVVLLSGRTQNTDSSSFGIVIFRAEDSEEAHRIMTEDPAVKHGLMRAELFPYRIAILGTGEGFSPGS